ncbi:hypothetical protein [Hanstruepera ponticola]|uniref:hypothetical protein n=1 Tax=Hanstruepera ponticola TaxID=2042995 RepID=UPI000CF12DC5|nr:hypothetical protein [Hanstruepera ponticola]
MNLFKKCLVIFTILLVSQITFAQENDKEIPTKEISEVVEVKGTITEINKETRDITIMGSKGDLHTITAGPEVERFDEIEVGEVVTFDFYKYVKAEFRKPTEAELAEPLVIIAEAGKADLDVEPGAAVGAMVKAVVTIQVINLPFMFVNIQGPQGDFTTIHMKDKDLIQKLHVGQVVILTYAEAVAVSLTKVD